MLGETENRFSLTRAALGAQYKRAHGKRFLISLFLVIPSVFCVCFGIKARAASMAIDSLSGPVIQDEINSFKAYMATQIPDPTPWGALNGTGHNAWADGPSGNALEAFGLMYEASGDITILNSMISWTDKCVSERNDLLSAANGGQRVMWTGNVAKVWVPNDPTSASAGYAGGENGDTKAHIAYCALLILQHPPLWNTTVPDGNPYGYGATYFQRATNYIAKCDEGNLTYDIPCFVTSGNLIRDPANWPSGYHTMEAINIQMMLDGSFERLAQCHEVLGDNPALVAQYDAIVNASANECLDGMKHSYQAGGHTVYKWYYYPWDVTHIESVGHAAYDMVGIWRAFNRSIYGISQSEVTPLADALVYVMSLGTNTFSGNVDGSGTTQNYMQAQWLLVGDWNSAAYDLVAAADLASGRYKTTPLMDATILWMKNRRYLSAPDFSMTATPASQTVLPGASTNYTVTVATNTSFSGVVSFGLSGLPANAGSSFSLTSLSGTGSSTLTVTTAANTPLGNYSLVLYGTNGTDVVSTVVILAIGNGMTGPATWNGGSEWDSTWSDPDNWGGTALQPGAALVFDGSTRLDPCNDTAAGTTYSNITFDAGAGEFVLTGNPIAVGGNVTNNSSNPQTLNLGLKFNSGFILNGATNTLVVGGGLTNTFGAPGSTTLTLAGAGLLTNLLNSSTSPGGTNVIVLASPAANWTLMDNPGSTAMTVPWAFSITNGTFNFGAANSAPILTSTSAQGVPSDNQIGQVSGSAAMLNVVNGILTTSARLNTATTAGATGIVNQVGGILNVGSQFQGANGGGAGEVSLVKVSGGTMNIGAGSGPLYVASRGSGTLTVSGSGVVNCGKLDISRNANGNAVSSVGVVNLDGGTLSVTSITNISANGQTGGGPAATFNFNGGTLMAKAGAAASFFQGCPVTPVTPIISIVKSGGAIIDDGGNAITVLEPLQHDSALSGTADGGLAKNGAGTLALTASSTYTGNTAVNAGTLALTGTGSINNSATIVVAAGATLDVSGRSDGTMTLASGGMLKGNGTVKGNVIIGSGAMLAPGGSLGTLRFNNNLTLNGGSTTVMEVSKSPLATNDAAQVSGSLLYGGTLLITNVSLGSFSAGDSFKLFNAVRYAGAFTNIVPAIPAVNLAWNTNGLDNGILSIMSSPMPRPQIRAISFTGNEFMFSGTNGVQWWPCYVLASSNLSLPLSNWIVVASNRFDAAGNVAFQITPTNAPQQFYLLRSP